MEADLLEATTAAHEAADQEREGIAMSEIYPRYYHESEARCFNCGKHLQDVLKSSYPAGQYQGSCNSCSMYTWFDLVPATKEIGNVQD